MIFKRITVGVLCLLLLGACATSQKGKRRREALARIDSHQVLPQQAFVYKDDLYICYEYENISFHFTAPVRPDHKKGVEYSLLNAHRSVPDLDKTLPVALVGREWIDLLKDTLQQMLPTKPLQGKIIFIQTYETLLYLDEYAEAHFVELGQAPAEIEIVQTIDASQFRAALFDRLKQEAEVSGTSYTRFLLQTEHIPLTPFMYVDTEEGLMTPLQLPPYYELEKEMNGVGFSLSFIWSFFIKSHFLGVIKAPFTSSWRLLSLASTSIYSALPPIYTDLSEIPPLNTSGEEMDLADFNKWLNKNVSHQNYKAHVELLIDGEEFFPHFMLALQRAEHSIFTRVYIFSTDPYGLKIADLFKRRSADGVDVRVLTDELNTLLNSKKIPELNYPADFVMPKSIKRYIRKNSRAKARTHYNTWATFDHTKVYLIDRELAYTGGMNIGEEYRYTWHDMMVALRGPVVGRLVKNFYVAWSFNGWGGDFSAAYRRLFSKRFRGQNREEPGMINVHLLYTKPGAAQIYHAQLEAIARAKKRIYIENAYFADDRIVRELIKARGRGVDVRVILPGENDVGVMDANNQIMANRLWRNGVKVYFYKGMTHVKAAIYDGWAVVGSANFDKMSLFVNQEMSLGIDDPAFVQELTERLFDKDFSNSELMTQERETGWASFLIAPITNQL